MKPVPQEASRRYPEWHLLRFTYSMPLVARMGPPFPALGRVFRYG